MKIKCTLNVCLIIAVIICLICPVLAGSKAETDEKEYFAVFMEGKKVGHAIQSRFVSDGKVTTSEEVSMTISRGGISMTIEMTETGIETIKGEPLGFETKQKLGAMGAEAHASMAAGCGNGRRPAPTDTEKGFERGHEVFG
jgi:hypothetical protein